MRIRALMFAAAAGVLLGGLAPRPASAGTWQSVLERARGQQVYFDAWGGSERFNTYIAWVARQVAACCDVTLREVPLENTSQAVTQVIAQKAAGQNRNGTIDLIWINGPNFYELKRRGLLYGPFAQRLPNHRLVSRRDRELRYDFTVPVDGYESPWRTAQLVFIYDSAYVKHVPLDIRAFPAWVRRHPGRFTFPQVENFLGVAFLEQALYALAPNPSVLERPVTPAAFAQATAPLWAWFAQLRPFLWRHGREYPASGPAERQLLEDGEIDLMPSFNPASAAVDVAAGRLPKSVRTVVLMGGTLGNASFVAIPYNAAHKAGAMVVANFLLSPAAQARAGEIRALGGPTVLDLAKLTPAQRARFRAQADNPWLPAAAALRHVLPEPHPSWAVRLAAAWERRYTP